MRSGRLCQFTLSFLAPPLMLAAFAGCGGSGGGASTTVPTQPTSPTLTAGNSLYLTANLAFLPNDEGPTILQFPRTANGSQSPAATITGPTGLNFDAVTVDAIGNLYAGGKFYSGTTQAGSEIVEYAAGASGKASPTRTITNGLNALMSTGIVSLAVDNASNLYVATDITVGSGPTGRIYQGIAVYAPGASTPSRVIAGDATGIQNPTQIALDSANNIYVASTGVEAAGSIEVFSPGATGDAAPLRTISGDLTTIYNTRGIAVDAKGNIYVSTTALAPANGPFLAGTPSIAVFSAGATGNVAPTNVISGSATLLGTVGNLRVDSAGVVYALSDAGIVMFAAGVNGNIAPKSTIAPVIMVGVRGPELAVQ